MRFIQNQDKNAVYPVASFKGGFQIHYLGSDIGYSIVGYPNLEDAREIKNGINLGYYSELNEAQRIFKAIVTNLNDDGNYIIGKLKDPDYHTLSNEATLVFTLPTH